MTDVPTPLLRVRAERFDEADAVRDLLETCAGGSAVADAVEVLRAAGALAPALVARRGGRVVGYAAWCPAVLEAPGARRSLPVLLALAGHPEARGEGAGRALLEAGLGFLHGRGEPACVALSGPADAFLGHLGFVAAPELAAPVPALARPLVAGAPLPAGRLRLLSAHRALVDAG